MTRAIFSRKGFDSAYGGGVSPVLPDGAMQSIGIPEAGSGIAYGDVQTPRGSLLELMHELGINRYRENKQWYPLVAKSEVHLDPDLHISARARHHAWRPVFGQCEGAQTVLRNRKVAKGDLFIFYGNFRRTVDVGGSLKFIGKTFHAIFGYMSVGDIVTVDGSTTLPWCAEHPHLVNRKRKNNTLYLASNVATFSGRKMSGAGIVSFDERRILSSTYERPSLWRLPSFFHPDISGRTMSNHLSKDWTLNDETALLQTKSPGQEYVVDATAEMIDWAAQVLR